MHTSPRGTGQPLEPVASTSFYGESQRPVARQPLRAISQSQRHSTDTSVAMDVDSQEKAAASVGINLDDDDTQFPNSPASMDELNEDTMINYPSVGTMQLQGHGYLPNAILGHSDHAGFQLGAAFGWPASFDAAALVDFNIDLKYSYVGRPTPSKASPNDNTVTPSPAIRSYSQAASTAASSSASPAPASASTNTAAGHSPVRQSSAGGSLATHQRESSSSSSATRFTTASIEKARPHPHAYYNIASQAWTVITAIPQDRTNSQIQSSISGQCMINNHETRKTHHYVRVPKGIDPRFILRPSETNIGSSDQPMQSHGSEPPLGGPSSAPFPDPSDPTHACWSGPASSAASCWDMYVCSGCRNAFTVSPPDVIPSILGREACRSFVESRLAEEGPRSGQVNDLSVIAFAMEYMWKVLRNVLYDNNRSMIPVQGTTFIKRMGKSQQALALFDRLHFTRKTLHDGKLALEPPPRTSTSTLFLSRAFLELSLWLANMAIAAGSAANTGREVLDLVRLEKFKPALEKLTGPDIVGKYVPSATDFNNIDAFANVFRSLGVTPETADEDIAFAYECQIRTDPKHLPYYLDSLAQVAQLRGDHREALQMLIATERSQDRFGHTEVVAALAKLNLHPIPDPERTFFNNPVHTLPNEELIAAAYQEGKDRVPIQQGTESDLKELKDAVAVLSKVLQSDYLKVLLDSTMPSKPSVNDITLEESWTYLQVTTDIADDMICSAVSIMFFNDDSVSDYQKEKAKAALSKIAEHRDSQGIRKFLDTGTIPESIDTPREAPTGVDRPAGLQNIGNTCYLNSLLQYFFTIKELREVVLNFDEYQETRPFEEIETSKRVGGRNITRREIERSTQFTKLLAQLFQQLIHEKVASVRPTRDLAYLALVSTKDEEDTKIASTNADASSMNVDSDVPASSADPRAGAEGLAAGQSVDLTDRKEKSGSPSVLGKRSSDHFEEEVAQMDVDGASPATRRTSPEAIGTDLRSLDQGDDKEDALIAQAGEDGVMEIIPEGEARKASVPKSEPEEKANPPPLPPRKTSTLETNMMFGRQQDVGEAMDNVLFQIEAALDDSKIPKPSRPPTLAGKPCSFVQSLFYGCTQQKLEFEAEEDGARLKEETFGYQLIDVTEDGHDLYDGLDAAYTPSLVEIDGKKARRQDIITQLPPIFQIQLQRVQFDRIKKQVYKCNAYMPFPQTLRLGRYLSPEGRSPEFAAKLSRSRELRSELTSLQAKLARLEQKDDDKQTLPNILTTASDSLRQLRQAEDAGDDAFMQQLRSMLGEGDDNVVDTLTKHANAIENDVVEAKQRLDSCRREVDEIWSDDQENEYELSSVFIHLGAAGYGHYYLYQRALPHQPERWLKFNDASVTDVDVSEVFKDTTDTNANPYWLTYVRKTEIPQRIDAVCRNFV